MKEFCIYAIRFKAIAMEFQKNRQFLKNKNKNKFVYKQAFLMWSFVKGKYVGVINKHYC